MVRHTEQRQCILKAVKLAAPAVTADDVLRRVRKACPSINEATVYRNLTFLAKRGEIYAVDGADGVKRFIGHSFHDQTFRCQRCGQVQKLALEDLVDAVKYRLRKQPVFYSRLDVVGLCSTCAKKLTK